MKRVMKRTSGTRDPIGRDEKHTGGTVDARIGTQPWTARNSGHRQDIEHDAQLCTGRSEHEKGRALCPSWTNERQVRAGRGQSR